MDQSTLIFFGIIISVFSFGAGWLAGFLQARWQDEKEQEEFVKEVIRELHPSNVEAGSAS